MLDRLRFAPAGIFAFGCALLLSVQAQRTMPLQQPLAGLDDPVAGYEHVDVVVPPAEARVAGMSSYVNRIYRTSDSLDVLGLYVGYYDSQRQGRTVHSPKNCLPGGGWEPMDAKRVAIPHAGGAAEVNRYVIAHTETGQRALVYYWYQGRGRVAANEYLVKWHLLRDAALSRRTDEALVRLVVPVHDRMSLEEADQMAERAARKLIADLDGYLPA